MGRVRQWRVRGSLVAERVSVAGQSGFTLADSVIPDLEGEAQDVSSSEFAFVHIANVWRNDASSQGSLLKAALALSIDRRQLEEAMKSFAKSVQRFLVSEDGPTAVEYAVMLALIVIVCLTAISAIGTSANTTFQNVADQLGAAS